MEKHLQTAKWIWCTDAPQNDEYSEFVDMFIYNEGHVFLRISADSNYAAYLNGTLIASGQYADFPHDKIYDEIDITSHCKVGKNRLAILVWYYGIDTTSVYYPGNAGLLYEVTNGGFLLCESNEFTMCRMSKVYYNHQAKSITPQLGFSYSYDATKEDVWLTEHVVGFASSHVVTQTLPLRQRPCNRLTWLPFVSTVECKKLSNTDIIYDLGKETVGLLHFEFTSPCEQWISIAYGEHLVDGCVRQQIGIRDFSITYHAKAGKNIFTNPFRRFACRYLEVHSKQALTMESLGLIPTVYKLQEQKRPILNEAQTKIYDMCVETLRLCMHEHYEDCPWREQALYAMDSRNQMLCGYYAFGEYEFPRANLQLISKDNRADGLLSICYPMKFDLVIPSFSLHYITGCAEYLEHSGDTDFIREIYPKLCSIAETFTNRLENGLITPFHGDAYWNFYEWKSDLDDEPRSYRQDLLINCLLSIALQKLKQIADALNIENDYELQSVNLNKQIRKYFWDDKKQLFYNSTEHTAYSQLGNALAILCGVATSDEAAVLCEHMMNDAEMTPISLSMVCFKYDAWLKVNKEKYTSIILEDIERVYKPMIDFGSTTVWETEGGQADFDNAGSLCHGWSALPIYYYHTLL